MKKLNKLSFLFMLLVSLCYGVDSFAQCEGTPCPATGPAGSFIFTSEGYICAYDADGNCRDFIAPLPVELTYFRTQQINGQQIDLIWETASEENNDYFEIMKSTDGITFLPIRRIQGKGTTSEAQQYTFNDNSPVNGENYYMLRQVDFDGTDSNSDIISTTYRPEIEFKTVRKSVNGDEVQMSYNTINAGVYDLFVIDISGKVLSQSSISLNEGINEIDFEIANSGVFMVILTDGKERLTDKIFK